MTYPLSLLLGVFTVVELNCENLFDCRHDSMKHNKQSLPSSSYHWTPRRYRQKMDYIGQTVLPCGKPDEGWPLPDLVVLCEVEDDNCSVDLTKWSLLRKVRYECVMIHSPDERDTDVALLYFPLSFQLLQSCFIRIRPMKEMRPMCDILYTKGRVSLRDTLHAFMVHVPSRTAGERPTYTHHRLVINRLLRLVDSLRALSTHPHVLPMGDFNDYSKDENIRRLTEYSLIDVSQQAVGMHGAERTYRYRNDRGSLDRIMADKYTA